MGFLYRGFRMIFHLGLIIYASILWVSSLGEQEYSPAGSNRFIKVSINHYSFFILILYTILEYQPYLKPRIIYNESFTGEACN